MLWYLNEYLVNDKLKYKIVRSSQAYQNWELLNTYILYDDKFITRETFRNIDITPKQNMFKKLLEFFNRL